MPVAKIRKFSPRKAPFTLKVEIIEGSTFLTLSQMIENVEHKVCINPSTVPSLLKSLVEFSVFAYRKSLVDQFNEPVG